MIVDVLFLSWFCLPVIDELKHVSKGMH